MLRIAHMRSIAQFIPVSQALGKSLGINLYKMVGILNIFLFLII